MAKTTKTNPHAGSSFDDFLKEDGIFEEVQARALKRAATACLNSQGRQSYVSKQNARSSSSLTPRTTRQRPSGA